MYIFQATAQVCGFLSELPPGFPLSASRTKSDFFSQAFTALVKAARTASNSAYKEEYVKLLRDIKTNINICILELEVEDLFKTHGPLFTGCSSTVPTKLSLPPPPLISTSFFTEQVGVFDPFPSEVPAVENKTPKCSIVSPFSPVSSVKEGEILEPTESFWARAEANQFLQKFFSEEFELLKPKKSQVKVILGAIKIFQKAIDDIKKQAQYFFPNALAIYWLDK